MSAWVLPDHIADILPSEARHIEKLRREMLDVACGYGYELVMPPMFEHLESLLTGTGEALDLQTFKLVDQISGRMLGLRADTTQQVARIDAHLLNRQGIARLCYCGPVLHTWPDRPHSTREPLQFGAEIYGYEGMEADLETVELSLACLDVAKVPDVTVDFADVRIVSCILSAAQVFEHQQVRDIHAALAAKDASALSSLTRNFPDASREGLIALLQLYGDASVLAEAEKALKRIPETDLVISNLRWLAERVEGAKVSFDLADLRGYAYYSGVRFALYTDKAKDVLVRGGRYDEVGAAFGRNRPAAGFSLDLKQLATVAPAHSQKAGIRTLWQESAELKRVVSALRSQGEAVVCVMPGNSNMNEFFCDRELAYINGHWVVQTL